MQRVLLGVSGSIACYKAAQLVRLLRAQGIAVQVMMTPQATQLVGAPTFRALSGQPVLLDEWNAPQSADGMDHIAAVRNADALLVAPASADFIAKAAAGIADNLLLAAFLAADCRKYLAPAMNRQMWTAAATQRNIARLQEDGVDIFGPAAGEQACGENGMGRMLEAPDLAAALLEAAPKPLAGQRIVVSTGATVEKLDAMRVISNRSSGEMGFCLAQAATALGAEVRVVAGQTTHPAPADLPLRRAIDSEAMRQAVLEETADADWFFSVAAVADFRPAEPMAAKAARRQGVWQLKLMPTADILGEAAHVRPTLRCLGFAAQNGAPAQQEKEARAKMKKKGVRYIALNDVAAAGSAETQLTLLFEGGKVALPRLPKMRAAQELLTAMVSYETKNKGTL